MVTRLIFVVGILILFLAGLALLTHHPGFALRVMIYSFYIFGLGTLLYILYLKNEK